MATTDYISTHLTDLSDSLKATNALITRLSKLSFQPGSEPAEESGSVRVELAQDIHDSLKQLEEDLELLKQEAEDFHNVGSTRGRRHSSSFGTEQDRVTAHIARLEEDLRASRSSFRRASLAAKKNSDIAKQQERELVYARLRSPPTPASDSASGSTNPPTDHLFAGRRQLAQRSKLNKEELEVDASSNVTAALRRTHDLLSTELSRSRFAQETFDESTAALAELGEHYTNLDTILSTSRNLLGTLLRSQKSDTWYLETAFYILIATLSWLIFRRILLGPFIRLPWFLVRWFILKPLWLFLSLTGVITTSPASGATTASRALTSTRRPLIVQPSAQGGSPNVKVGDLISDRGVPAGAGGANAKRGKQGELSGPESEKIAKMTEDSAKQDQQAPEQVKEPVRRGDGTVLQERGEVPPNPKKKVFDVGVEDAKYAEQQRQQQSQEGHQRDEL